MRPTPAIGARSTGETPCSSRLPTRSHGITPRRPRSADVASAWRSGDGRQDPAADSGPLRAHRRPGPTTSRATVAGTAVPAHRPAHHEAYRSTGKHPPTAANTVRAALEQNPLLLTNQERYRDFYAGRTPSRAGARGVGTRRRAARSTAGRARRNGLHIQRRADIRIGAGEDRNALRDGHRLRGARRGDPRGPDASKNSTTTASRRPPNKLEQIRESMRTDKSDNS